jgi:hypothetical protein
MNPVCIVDIGTGTGVELHFAFVGYPAKLLQVDWRDQRDLRPQVKQASFLAANFESHADLEALETALDPLQSTLFIFADVIEHLQDPRPILRTLRILLKRHPANRLVVSTPDYDRLRDSCSHGLPKNSGRVRQWTLSEFSRAMMAAGFEVHRIEHVPQSHYVAELGCTPEHHNHWLEENGFPPQSDHMVLTTEYGSLTQTGGIGPYVQLAGEIDGGRLVLFAGATGLPEARRHAERAYGFIHVADLCGRGKWSLQKVATPDPDEILQAVVQAVFLYDGVRLIEYQDYLGIGLRVAQAKRAGLLPPSITVVAIAHGNQLYLDFAADEVDKCTSLIVHARERLSVELADCAVFPSLHVRDFYIKQAGFRTRAERHLRIPFRFAESGLQDASLGPIADLIFLGKNVRQKSFRKFVDALSALFDDPANAEAAKRVKRVVLIGIRDPDPRLRNLPVELECGVWNRTDVLTMLRDYAPNNLVVVPDPGDNHPVSLLEIIDCNSQVLAFDSGGFGELLPTELRNLLLCQPDARSLLLGMIRAISLSPRDRCQLLRETRIQLCVAYAAHTKAYQATMAELKLNPSASTELGEPGAVSVIVPNFNGSRVHLEDVAQGLRNSFQKPRQVVLVDDASTPENVTLLNEVAGSGFGDIPTEVICNATNIGLAGTRNVGLARVKTPYVCAHDNDNIVVNGFLLTACRILDANPQVAAVTSYLRLFEDGEVWQKETFGQQYRPYGADLGVGLRVNMLGDALSVYRVDVLRALGGWDSTSKAQWEDWQLLARLAASGHDIWVIPQGMCLYRLKTNSMGKTYPEFPAWMRLVDAVPGLPRAQAVSVLHALWRLSQWEEKDEELVPAGLPQALREVAKLEKELAGKENALARLRLIEGTTIWRAMVRLRLMVNAHPTLKAILRSAWHIAARRGRAKN